MSTLFKPVYRASAAVGVGTAFNALATSSTRTAGAQSDLYDNTSNLDDDVLLSGTVKLGTSPTAAKQVDIWIVPSKDGATTYPDVITAAGAATKTWTSENIRNGALPQKFVVFVSHDSAVNLDASAGFVCNALGIQYTSV